MTFRKTVLAYLTGWLIVQPLYNRLVHWWADHELKNPSERSRLVWKRQAEAIVRELHGMPHQAQRGDEVAVWLKRLRDEWGDETRSQREAWYVLDQALNDYRLHADTGTPLLIPVSDGGHDDAC